MSTLLLGCHAASTWALVGLIWQIQLVQYPLFGEVNAYDFPRYHRLHVKKISYVVAPLMILELTLGSLILLSNPTAVLAWIGVLLLIVVWSSTFFIQVPRHHKLSAGFDAAAHRSLVHSNWIRTLAWSARGVVVLVMLLGVSP